MQNPVVDAHFAVTHIDGHFPSISQQHDYDIRRYIRLDTSLILVFSYMPTQHHNICKRNKSV